VIRVKAEILALEQQLGVAATANGSAELPPLVNSSRPQDRKVPSEAGKELNSLREEEKALVQAIAMYQQRVDQAPLREQEYQKQFGDYKAIKDHHNALLQRYQEALVAESMEYGQKGDQVRILDSAIPSTRPAAPKLLRLIFIGLILSMGLAGGAVGLMEHRDTSFHSLRELQAFTKVPILATIPPIVTNTDTSRQQRRFWLRTASALIGLAILVATTYYIAQGNEQLVWMLDGKRT